MLLLNHIEPLAVITVINLDLGIHLCLKKRIFIISDSCSFDLIITNLDTTNHAVL